MEHVFLLGNSDIAIIEYKLEILNPPSTEVRNKANELLFKINEIVLNTSRSDEKKELGKLKKELAKIENTRYEGTFKLVGVKIVQQRPVNPNSIPVAFTIGGDAFRQINDEIENLAEDLEKENQWMTFEQACP